MHPLICELSFSEFVNSYEPFEEIITFIVNEKSNPTPNDRLQDLEMRFDYGEHIQSKLRLLQKISNHLFIRLYLSYSNCSLGYIAQARGNLDQAEKYYKQFYDLAKAIADKRVQ